ncbi:MAG TPA: zf-HC2 domain-containing protein [Ktedonobacterales bacterium]
MVEGNITCKELVEVITSYLDDALSPEERERFERHLALCPGCRAYLVQMRATLRLLGTLSAESLPETMQRELLAAFRGLRPFSGSS